MNRHTVYCASCKHCVGAASDLDQGHIKLYKWDIRLGPTPADTREQYPPGRFVAAQLLSMIESQGVQRFVIHSEDDEEDASPLLVNNSINLANKDLPAKRGKVWVFNSNTTYSSTLVPESPKQAMKVYYKYISNPNKILENESSKVDELRLPADAMRSFSSSLHASNSLLPVSARRFQEWSVGLLER